ncbi:CAAX protease [Sporosarcina ureae]|uniref:CAAX protease n=1 Tax=Sporosarcina ureae TaxID=1571 RepID=A0ABM6JZE3_SPOUR|nr:CAAX protease [Sporosarcina ureae]
MKKGSENIKRDIKTKDVMFAFSSLSLLCIAVLFGLVVYDVLTIQSLLSFNKPIESIVITGIASIALLLFGVVLTFSIPSNSIDGMNKTYQDGSLSSLFIFMFLAALFEEVLFRGIIQNLFFVYTGNQWVAILSATLLFLVFHIQYFKKPMMLMNITIPSIVFGWIYVKTNNLLVPVFVHFLMNFGMTILFKYKLISLKK